MSRFLTFVALAATFMLTVGSALAGPPVDVPEPATMSLLGVGVAAAFVIKGLGRKKK